MIYTVGSLFAGIGGFDLAFESAGFKTLWQVEKEPFCQQVLRKNFPHAALYGDIFECHNLPYVDVVTAGFPCQPFSLAGKRLGEQDERYLIPEMLRVIDEIQPLVCVFENVPGFASITDGHTFKQFLRALAEIGFDAEWGHLRASDAGAPHQRERWFCIAFMDDTKSRTSGHDSTYQKQAIGNVYPFKRTGLRTGAESALAYRAGDDGIITPTKRGQKAQGRRETQTFRGGSGSRKPAMGYPAGIRQQRYSTFAGSARMRKNARRLFQPQGTGTGELGNAYGKHRQKSGQSRQSICPISRRKRQNYRLGNAGLWQPQSRVGGTTHGVSARLDRHCFPARPGESQYNFEPPRVVSGKTPDRAARLKALGNAVVPQVVYPVALAIREWFEEQTEREAA